MVEGTGLENRHTGEPGIESSNLSLSVDVAIEVAGAAAFITPVAPVLSCEGRVAEWFKAHAWKVCVRESVPWVRIPPRPCESKICCVAMSTPFGISRPSAFRAVRHFASLL